MPDDNEAQVEGQEAPNRWKFPVMGLIIVVMLGLVVWQTYRTGEIPYTIAGPLLAASLWGLLGFRASDWRK